MKIAVQISGLLRDFQESYRALKRALLDHYDCDIYIAAAGGDDRYNASQEDIIKEVEPVAWTINNDLPHDYEQIVATYNNVKTKWFNGWHIPNRVDSVYAALYKKLQCNDLRRSSGRQYDVVMMTRADLVYAEPFVPLIIDYASTTTLIPHGSNWHGGVNDHFSIGPPLDADKIACLVHCYEWYMRKDLSSPHPERMLRHHINQVDINVRRFNYTYYLRGKEPI